ncbi:LOB domain-containing protein [Heracleum sosnowskyi]|uniref:LOB domain-containing protein n=1 Tax=Heracleum sosnowskyi TaxID=360622 RepID=A0AAD8GPN8_9APIA|nr:LOB domain-containing protein [Heracleum sosnowskyi]
MTGTGSPCGACKFLRRKCARGCVFAPYFCHEQGASHFSAIHKIFGASNVSKLLAHLPLSERGEAAVTISYEAQARVQDPIYGCVSHIFALQQQVVNLQTQLSSLKEQAAQNFPNGGGSGSTTSFTSGNPNDHMSSSSSYGNFKIPCNYTQDAQRWSNSENASMMMPQFDDLNISVKNDYSKNAYMNTESSANYNLQEANAALPSFEGASNYNYSVDPIYGDHNMQTSNQQWCFREDIDDLQSVAFGYVQY